MFPKDFNLLKITGLSQIPEVHKYINSRAQISKKRIADIEERRGNLKSSANDSPILKIVIEEMLAYKSTSFTLDDRYLELEKILDAIEEARTTQQTDNLMKLCKEIIEDISTSSYSLGKTINSFLTRLQEIEKRAAALQSPSLQAKL